MSTLSELVRILSLPEAVAVLHGLVTVPFSKDADAGKPLVSGPHWMQRVGPNSLTTCVLKNYFLEPLSTKSDEYTSNLVKLLSLCELVGLRLCGLRTAYVSPEVKSQEKKNSNTNQSHSASQYIHASILSQPFTSASREDCNLVLVACFYSPR